MLAELLAQHAALRDQMDRCEALAEAADRTGEVIELTREVAKLRLAFDAHNKFEEGYPIVREHVEEHRAIRTRLHGWITEELRDVIASMREHIEAEERPLRSSAASGLRSGSLAERR